MPGTHRAAVRNTGRDRETRRGQEQRVCRDREEADWRGRGDRGQGRLWGNGQGPQGPREPSGGVQGRGKKGSPADGGTTTGTTPNEGTCGAYI